MNGILVFGFLASLVASAIAADPPTLCVSKSIGTSNCMKAGLNVTCKADDDCVPKVADGTYDLTLASADDLVKNVDKVTILLGETYPKIENFVRYYAVAVVKKGAALKLNELKGKNTCHTGVGKTAGWKIPIGYLLEQKIMPLTKDAYKSAADFFNQSCVPGIANVKPSKEVQDKLCALCKTNCTSSSPYAGYAGAFQCLADGKGDVAFVKHDTPTGDYELLCRNGSRTALADFKTCNVGKRPAGAFVTANSNKAKADMYRGLLSKNVTALKEAKILTGANGLKKYDDTTEMYLGDYSDFVKSVNMKKTSGASSVTTSLLLQLCAVLFYFFAF